MSEDVERMLRQMRLRRPSGRLDQRVVGRPGRRKVLGWVALASTAAAAVILIAALWPRGQAPRPAPTEVVQQGPTVPALPVRAEQTTCDVQYEGLLLLNDHGPFRKFRCRGVRRILWMDEHAGLVDELSIPTEEVILIRAETY